MRYYLLGQDEEELVIDLQLIKKHSNELFEFQLVCSFFLVFSRGVVLAFTPITCEPHQVTHFSPPPTGQFPSRRLHPQFDRLPG